MKTTIFPVAMKHLDHCPPEWQIPTNPALVPVATATTRRRTRQVFGRTSLQFSRRVFARRGVASECDVDHDPSVMSIQDVSAVTR